MRVNVIVNKIKQLQELRLLKPGQIGQNFDTFNYKSVILFL